MRWSDSETKNFSLAASLSSILSFGLKNIAGTESIDTTVKSSSVHSNYSEIISIFERGGSNGNSTIFLPRVVRLPVLSKAPRIHNWYIEFKILS